MMVVGELSVPSITVTLEPLRFPTYILFVIGLTATASGEFPTKTVEVELSVPSMTVTLLLSFLFGNIDFIGNRINGDIERDWIPTDIDRLFGVDPCRLRTVTVLLVGLVE